MSGALGILTEPDVQVPMRDGVHMAAHVFRPDADGQFPGILLRTPYDRPKSGFERYVRARVRRSLHGFARPLRLRGRLGAVHRRAHGRPPRTATTPWSG